MDSDTDTQEEQPQKQKQKEKPTHEHTFKTRQPLSKKEEKKAEMQFTVFQGSFTLFDDWKLC